MFRCGRKKFFTREEGSIAIEYAILGLPFLMLLVGIIELALFFATGVVMEGAANDAARMVRTGQVALSVDPVKTFEDELCNKIGLLVNCVNLQYEVRIVPNNTFSNVSTLLPKYDEFGKLIPEPFAAGGANDVILVRVVYQHKFLTPFLGDIMAEDTGTQLSTLMSTVVVKNEPYSFGG